MKATGIVRRIDDLGRVVVPKEIRRTLRIREGEPMEIFTGREGEIVLKKYSPIGELSKYAREFAEAISAVTGYLACISDHDQIVAAVGPDQKEYNQKAISEELERVITNRECVTVSSDSRQRLELMSDKEAHYQSAIVAPIISAGDAIGSVIICSNKEEVGETEKKIAQTASAVLGKQMED
ncbi:MAG: stage V sporulation protein T [Ruminococcus sp.]|jgi:AbrB family transcriptional regulator (stage V sporulation protein T)